ncbi:MAG: prepilin peptidase [archaeon]
MDGVPLLSNALPLIPLSFVMPFAFLILASIQDWYYREVSDWLWVAMLCFAAPLTFLRLLIENMFLVYFLVTVVPAALIAVILCEMGFFGGADAKAIIFIALTTPTPPPSTQTFWPLHTSFALGVLTNAMFLASLMTFYVLCRNMPKVLTGKIEWEEGIGRWSKCLILISSYFVSAEEFQKKKAFLSRVNQRKIWPQYDDNGDQEQNQPPLSGQVLVTPQLPLIVFITVGYMLAFRIGDILSRLALLILWEFQLGL